MSRVLVQRSWWAGIWPPAVRETTWKNVVPLGVFLLGFLALILLLEGQRWVRFSDRGALSLIVLSGWVWWHHHQGYHGLSARRAAVALYSRWIMLGLFAMMLAGPQALRQNDQLSLMYALDLSDSISRGVQDEAIRYVLETAGSKEEGDHVGLVLFGREAAVELPPGPSFPFEAINSQFARDGTNLEKGLAMAAAVIPEENAGRIVLISDGTATEGEVNSVVNRLNGRGISVDVLPVEMNLEKEVWLERIDLPRAVKQGETYEAHVIFSAVHAGKGTLLVLENGAEIHRRELEFQPGKQRATVPLYLREAGFYEYSARLLMPEGEDGWEGNNVAVNDLFLRGEGKTLVVTEPDGNPADWESLVEAMRASGRVVEVINAYGFPRTAVSLMPYDSVVFVNVPADALDVVQLASVKQAVYHHGMGFLMVGGGHSFGPGGYHRTAIEETLPVSMDIKQKKILPKGALVMILHTCEFEEGNTWGKRIAKQAVRVLGNEDEVGVIDYEQGKEQWLFPLTTVENYDHLIMRINQAVPGDMPSFAPTMQLALEGLQGSDAAMKHMIIISDGDPTPPVPALLQAFVDEKVSISTVGINPHTPNDTAILRQIAAVTGGRFYEPFDSAELPSIFIKEAKTLKRSMIQNETFVPRVEFPSPVLRGIDALPELHGYVLTSPKPRAHTLLRGPEEEEINPVLAVWRYGTGSAAAFTSDLSPNWGADWVGWDRYRAFVSQLMTEIARVDEASALEMRVVAVGDQGIITVEDQAEASGFLDLQARVVGPNEREETLRLEQTAPRRYRGTFPLWGTGRYQVMAAASGAGRSDKAAASLPVAYSPEYLQLRSHPALLENLAARTGGRVLSGEESDLFDFERVPKESSRSMADWFMLALACWLPLDVGWRRVQLDWQALRGRWRRRRETPSGETMGALLRRKSDLGAQLEARPFSPRRTASPSPDSSTKAATPLTKPQEDSASHHSSLDLEAESGEREMSTTERLLALKRKRQERDRKEK